MSKSVWPCLLLLLLLPRAHNPTVSSSSSNRQGQAACGWLPCYCCLCFLPRTTTARAASSPATAAPSLVNMCLLALLPLPPPSRPQVNVRILGGLMALGYCIGTIMKRSSTILAQDGVTVKVDDVAGLGQFVQVCACGVCEGGGGGAGYLGSWLAA